MLAVSSPLARRLMTIVAALSIAVTGAATIATFAFVQNDAADRERAHLEEYVAERAKSEDRLFSDLVSVHEAATVALVRRMDTMDPATVDRDFDRYFPLRPDGTRRSTPALFDGMSVDSDRLFGIGAYLSDGAHVSFDEKRMLLAALHVTAHTGETGLGRYDNFYLFTPTQRFLMFGPQRRDRLMYYRRDAPAGVSFVKDEMFQLVLPANNPERAMRCSKLRRLISDPKGAALTSVCTTPIDVAGKHVAAWGTTVTVNSQLMRAVEDALPGATNMIVAADGTLIAYPGLNRDGTVDIGVLNQAQKRHRPDRLVREIQAQGRPTGVVRSGDRVIAYGLLKEPGWYFLMSFSSAAILWSAAKSASWVLLFGLAGVIAQTLLLYRFTRLEVVQPLRALAQAGMSGRNADQLERRQDEIGVLARALRWQKARNDELLRSLEERVVERTAELERANRAKSMFLANMSHELRTPLNGVIAIADQLAEEKGVRRRRELAGVVSASGRLLEQVLGDILDVSKIEAGQFSLSPAPFDLTAEVQAIAELHRAAAEAKGLAYRWAVTPEAAGAYLGDAPRIAQILSNLLANAVKFTDRGEVTLRVERARGGGLLFCVRDTGVGFDEEVRGRLFRRFEQADDSITRRFGGTGLGLSICASLTEMMGGEIGARSRPGKGAVFEVMLPLPPAEASPAPRRDPAVAGPVDLNGLRVLVAEDHPTNRKVVEIMLEPFGVDLTVVENGQEALELARTQAFDAVLMDLQMPVMDGLTATRLIREHELATRRPRTWIVMLTAAAMDEHIAQARAAGADLHVAKPVRPAELLAALAERLTPAQPRSASA